MIDEETPLIRIMLLRACGGGGERPQKCKGGILPRVVTFPMSDGKPALTSAERFGSGMPTVMDDCLATHSTASVCRGL